MRILNAYLWKEWRDHRTIILAFLVGAPLFAMLLMLWLPARLGRAPVLPSVAAMIGLLVAMLSVASDVVPGELRRGTLAFLARMPADLGMAFGAKLGFAVLVCIAFASHAYLSATLAASVIRGGPWLPPYETAGIASPYLLVPLGLWIFAASCMLPRGTLALPGSVVLLSLLGAPIAFVYFRHREISIRPTEFRNQLAWLYVVALVTAAVAFLKGMRFGRSGWSTTWRGLVVAGIGFTPLYGWTGWKYFYASRIDPRDHDFRVWSAEVGEGGQFAFLNVYHGDGRSEYAVLHALVVDLDTGAWRDEGGGTFFNSQISLALSNAASLDDEGLVPLSQESMLCNDSTRPVPWTAVRRHGGGLWTGHRDFCVDARDEHWIDARTGKSLEELAHFENREDRIRAAARARAPVQLQDGRRCWIGPHHTVECDTSDGGWRELPDSLIEGPAQVCGMGFRSKKGVYDVTRERAYELPKDVNSVTNVRPGSWLAFRVHPSRPPQWELWNPDTGAFRPLPDVMDSRSIRWMHDDGRFFVIVKEEKTKSSRLLLVDPDTGETTELALPAPLDHRLGYFRPVARTPGGQVVCEVYSWPFNVLHLVWLDLQSGLASVVSCPNQSSGCVVACLDDDSVLLVTQERGLARLRRSDGKLETLFPK